MLKKTCIGIGLGFVLSACGTKQTYDYSNFQKYSPRSILVLPPDNQGTDIRGTYGYLSTTTRPVAEMGYYVFPVEIVDLFMKENGLPTPGEMHRVSLKKIDEIIHPDAVMYITLESYGSEYQLVNSETKVSAKAKLVNTSNGVTLWEGTVKVSDSSNKGGSSSLLGMIVDAAVSQAVKSTWDSAHNLSRVANEELFSTPGHGLLPGPYAKKN